MNISRFHPDHIKKALIIGLDGARPDAIKVAHTPVLDALLRHSWVCFQTLTEIQTISGAAWTSLLTGVHSFKHHVFDNNFSTRDPQFPTFFSLLKAQRPQIRTVAHSHWKPIITKIFEPGSLDVQSSGSDRKMAYRIAKDIEKDKGDLYFVQLDDIDGAGHRHSYGPNSIKYLQKIEDTDALLKPMIQAINNRPDDEDWMIIVISDHGGLGKSHGKPTMDELTIIFVVFTKDGLAHEMIPENEDDAPAIVDVVPTLAQHFGLDVQTWWDGQIRP